MELQVFFQFTAVGGGVGLSVHGSFRIATEKTLFAMPETAIGFFPDVGSSFFLPKLEGELGTYLALTGARLKGQDVYHAGISTHYVPSSRISDLKDRICDVGLNTKQLSSAIEMFSAEYEPYSLTELKDSIDECFKSNSVIEIVDSLKSKLSSSDSKISEWAKKTVAELESASPISLQVTLFMLRKNKKASIKNCLESEYGISQAFMKEPDFIEGVQSKLIEKRPSVFASKLQESALPQYFSESLPIEFHNQTDLSKYPTHFGLPTEKMIKQVVSSNKLESVEDLFRKFDDKVGLDKLIAQVAKKNLIVQDGILAWKKK